jgi:hypothetical protein
MKHLYNPNAVSFDVCTSVYSSAANHLHVKNTALVGCSGHLRPVVLKGAVDH